jgi:hypothetical protein
MPMFSIIVVHYQGVVAHDIFRRGIESIRAQTFGDYELLCYHDGPLLEAAAPLPCDVKTTPARFNDWGHSLRDIGIRKASGDYIVHFNADNLLYPAALEMIAAEIRRPPRVFDQKGNVLDTDAMVIFPIIVHGLQRVGKHVVPFRSTDGGVLPFFEILTGNPPILFNIDAMQLVMKRSLWLDEGGWTDKSHSGDGRMYERFAAKYGYRTVGPVLGEHF